MPKKPSYVVPDMSWKRDDMRAAEDYQRNKELQGGLRAYYEGRKFGEDGKYQGDVLADYMAGKDWADAIYAAGANTQRLPRQPIPSEWTPSLTSFFTLPWAHKTGQDLVRPANESEILEDSYGAAMRTYIAASINVQRFSVNSWKKDSGNGPAQISWLQLNTGYGVGYPSGCKNKNPCTGYGLGLFGQNPFNDQTVVEGMRRRIQQVYDEAERLEEKSSIELDETDKFIIAAMAQNGGGFDLNDIQDVMRIKDYHSSDGKIQWNKYFEVRQTGWKKRVDRTKWWQFVEKWQQSRTGGADYNTKFMLEQFYAEATDLQTEGYYLPDNLDTELIEDLISTNK